MKSLFTVFLLLAVASLGLAFPQPKSTPVSSTPVPAAAPTTPASASPLTVESVDAALGGNISPKCGQAILSIVISPEFLKCIPVAAFPPLLPIVTDPNFLKNLKADPAGSFKKIEPAFVQFSKAFCPAPKCSDAGVAGAIKILSDGCQTDLQTNPLIQLLFAATVFYSPLHDNICFEDKKTNKFCWDESLTTIFSLPKSPIKIIDGGLIDSIAVADPFVMCTTCNKDIVNTFGNFLKNNKLALQILTQLGITDKQLELITVGIAVKCGINFEDGKIPG